MARGSTLTAAAGPVRPAVAQGAEIPRPGLAFALLGVVQASLTGAIAIVLLAFMPLQFTWAAVASYCRHEAQVEVSYVSHHHHQHHADAGEDAVPRVDLDANLNSTADAKGDEAPDSMDIDCGHCHGSCVILTLPATLPGMPGSAPLHPTFDDATGAHTPARPERPQWLPLA